MKRKLIKFSNYSFCITLPKKAVEALGWTKGEEVEVNFESRSKRIIVNKNSKTQIQKISQQKSTDSEEIQPIPKLRW